MQAASSQNKRRRTDDGEDKDRDSDKDEKSPALHYVKGDATKLEFGGDEWQPKILAHVVNDRGWWGKGFVLALNKSFPEPKRAYQTWARLECGFELGNVQFVPLDEYDHIVQVANMIAQHGVKPDKDTGRPPIRYGALHRALDRVGEEAVRAGASVHVPRIGTGLAGGKWSRIEPMLLGLVEDHGVDVYVYDL